MLSNEYQYNLEFFQYKLHATGVQAICRDVYGGQDYLPTLLAERYGSEGSSVASNDPCVERYYVLCRSKPSAVHREVVADAEDTIDQVDAPLVAAVGGYFLLSPGHYWIQGVRVAAAQRGKGLGLGITSAVVRALEQFGKNSQQTLHLWSCTITDNKPMRRIFRKLGFVEFQRCWLWPSPTFMQILRRIDERIASAPNHVRETFATMLKATRWETPAEESSEPCIIDASTDQRVSMQPESFWETVPSPAGAFEALTRHRLCVPLYYWCLPPEALEKGAISVDWLWIGQYKGEDRALGWIFVYREPLIQTSDPTVAGVIASSCKVLLSAVQHLNRMFPRFRTVMDTSLFPSNECRIPEGFRRWSAASQMVNVYRKLELKNAESEARSDCVGQRPGAFACLTPQCAAE